MSGVDESDYCPDIDDMVVIAVPAAPAKVVNTTPKAHNYKCGSCGYDFGDNHLELEEHIKHNNCGFNEVEDPMCDPSYDLEEDFSDDTENLMTPFDRQAVLRAIFDCNKFSDQYKLELDLKLSSLWGDV